MNLGLYIEAHKPTGALRDRDYLVEDLGDGTGSQITLWDEAVMGPRPTPEQVAAWDPSAKIVRLYAYLPPNSGDPRTPPVDVDFSVASTVELHKRVEDVWRGDQRRIEYYAAYDPATGVCSQPVVQRTFAISYPDNALRVDVVEMLAWYCNDGTLHPATKSLSRYYDGQRWLDWLESRRAQIIAWLRYNVAAAMMADLIPQGWTVAQIMVEGGQFFKEHGLAISSYIAGYDPTFPADVQADKRTWLDAPWPGSSAAQTIRQKFAEQLIYSGGP